MTTFSVTWGDKPPTGKVFARKRKANTPEEKSPVKTAKLAKIADRKKDLQKRKPVQLKVAESGKPENFRKQQDVKKLLTTARSSLTEDHSKNVPDSSETTGFIKRKKKKDKLLSKAAVEAAETVSKGQDHSLFSVHHKDVHVRTNSGGKSVVERVFSANRKFSNLDIHRHIISNLEKIGFTTLTTVQEKAIPAVLKGDNVLVRSQTGSGKTLVYAVPILDALQNINPRLQRSDGTQAIIVVPTRELALQVHELFTKINTFQWLVVGHLCGGENRNTEKNRLRKGVHILIGTPGRLLDHMMHTQAFKLDNVRCLVLDEADRLLDMGFKRDIIGMVEALNKSTADYNPMDLLKRSHKKFEGDTSELERHTDSSESSPLKDVKSKKRQTILLSATLSEGIAELADFTMKEHTYIDALDSFLPTLSHDVMVIPDTVKQKFIVTYVKHRLFTLSAMLLSLTKKCCKIFVFMGSSAMVDYHYELFVNHLAKMPMNRGKMKSGDVVVLNGVDESDEEEEVMDVEFFKLHGSMDQSARKEVFGKFRSVKKGVLICTDVVARGIDVPAADCIIQYTGPLAVQDYLHKVGRTGRAGKSGVSYIFLTHEEQDFVTEMEKYKVYLKQEQTEPYLAELALLMEESDLQKAAIALQKHYENALARDKNLHRMACLAYSSWSRFYNTFSRQLKPIFDFKKVNLGHYVTSFGLKETPTQVAKYVRGQVAKVEAPKINRKLAIHDDEEQPMKKRKKVKSFGLTTSEFSSGLQFKKKKKKKVDD